MSSPPFISSSWSTGNSGLVDVKVYDPIPAALSASSSVYGTSFSIFSLAKVEEKKNKEIFKLPVPQNISIYLQSAFHVFSIMERRHFVFWQTTSAEPKFTFGKALRKLQKMFVIIWETDAWGLMFARIAKLNRLYTRKHAFYLQARSSVEPSPFVGNAKRDVRFCIIYNSMKQSHCEYNSHAIH